MNIVIDRDSVCLGDDIDSHKKIYQMDDTSTYEELFETLMNDMYFPSISGNNVVWVLTSKNCECIFSYFTRTGKMFPGLFEKSLYKLCNDTRNPSDEFMLKYYTTPLKWKEHISEMYDGNMHDLWHDGWLEKLKYCDYVMSLGMEQNSNNNSSTPD